ncbi:hypothetical protein ADK34_32585, partial [Streptomyces viridochromogenes]
LPHTEARTAEALPVPDADAVAAPAATHARAAPAASRTEAAGRPPRAASGAAEARAADHEAA